METAKDNPLPDGWALCAFCGEPELSDHGWLDADGACFECRVWSPEELASEKKRRRALESAGKAPKDDLEEDRRP